MKTMAACISVYWTTLLAFFCLLQSFLVSCGHSEEYGAQFNAALAAQVAANRAAIAHTLAEKYWAQARAEHNIAIDHTRKAREKAYYADAYKKRAEKLEEVAKTEDKLAEEDKKQAKLLENNAKSIKVKARQIESKAKIKENLALHYKAKAKEQSKEAQLAEIANKESSAKAEQYEHVSKDTDKIVADLEKSIDHIKSVIKGLRIKAKEYLQSSENEKAKAAKHLKRAKIYKRNAKEYERAATKTELSAKEMHLTAIGLHMQAEEERSKIKVEDVKSKYDKYIAQLFQSQATDNKYFSDNQMKESKFYEGRAKIAKTRAAAYLKSAKEIKRTALAYKLESGTTVTDETTETTPEYTETTTETTTEEPYEYTETTTEEPYEYTETTTEDSYGDYVIEHSTEYYRYFKHSFK